MTGRHRRARLGVQGCGRCGSASSAARARLARRSAPGWRRWATRWCSAPGRSTGRWRLVDELARASGPTASSRIDAGDNDGAADADLVVIATPWDSAATTAHEHADAARPARSSSSMANALVRVGNEFQPLVPPRGSVAAHVQAAVPRLPRRRRVPPPAGEASSATSASPIESDVLICCDDPKRRRDRHRDRRARSPAAGRSTPASCPTPPPSRRSPPCCCSSTCATRPGWRPKLTGINAT